MRKEELNWGIIGCGDVVERKFMPSIIKTKHSKVTAVFGRDRDKVEAFTKKYDIQKSYTSIDDFLKDKEIDIVYIATPTYVHAEQTIMSANAGKHVLCEKPMALNVKEGKEMITAAKANQVQLMIAFYRRFYPVVTKIKEIISMELIGKLITARVFSGSLYSPTSKQKHNWRGDASLSGGGWIWDVGSHRLDLLVFLLGKPEEVSAYLSSVYIDLQVEDSCVLILEFENKIQLSSTFNWNIYGSFDEFAIYGTEGYVKTCDLETGDLIVCTKESHSSYHLPRVLPTHLPVIENFTKSINEGRKNICTGEMGLETSKILEAATLSSNKKRSVRLCTL
ncbi:Oxidoreductase P35 [subsurface metagenome]